MKSFGQYLNMMKLMEDAGPPPGGAAPPPGGPPGGPPPGGPPMGGPPMGGPPPGGPPMGGPPGAPGGAGGQGPTKLKSTNVWDVLEKYLSGAGQTGSA